jgi:cytochrome c-type biogenesis protein CcmF
MIRLFGHLSLSIACAYAIIQCALPLIGYWRKNNYLLAAARPCAIGQCFFVLLAYVLLTIAFVTNDFSIAYVAHNSHATLPLMYRLTAVWGAHEGSILLWIVLLNLWTLTVCIALKRKSQLHAEHYSFTALTLSLLGLLSVCFLTFLLLTSNPFAAATSLSNGSDLNPLLQDPGFVIHPPMLYIGYVGFSVAFAMFLAALIRGDFNQHTARIIKQFAVAAWCFLTLGITLGSWWAYRVLGWGGFWFWDPVENASLLPWLSGTALIHILALCEKRDIAKGYAGILAITTFALSLLGTFLVRSGVLISAHTFASDPARGIFLLILLGIVTTGALILFVKRLSSFKNSPHQFQLLSRETGLLLNSALLLVAMTTILLGTLYPLMLDAMKLGAISVGAPYFNKVMLPLVLITMTFMAVAPLLHWQQQSLRKLLTQTMPHLVFSVIVAIILLYTVVDSLDLLSTISLTLSIWIISVAIKPFRFYPGMALAHIGFALLVIGVLLSSLLNVERDVRMQPGSQEKIGPYQFRFVDAKGVSGSNFRGVQVNFDVTKNGRHIVNLYPEKRIFLVREMVMTKVDIHPSLFRDLYIALGEPLEQDAWTVRLYYKPFVRWIWIGGIIMMFGGIVSIVRMSKVRDSHAPI